MHVTVYGNFNSLLSYLASQRADWLVRTATAEIDWRAVEHCRQMPVTGIRSDPGDPGWQRELAETGALALPGERLPAAPPPVVSNTRASVAACAEAVTDGVEDELRRRLFEAIWAQREWGILSVLRRAIDGREVWSWLFSPSGAGRMGQPSARGMRAHRCSGEAELRAWREVQAVVMTDWLCPARSYAQCEPSELTDGELAGRVYRQARCASSCLDPDEWFPLALDVAKARDQAASAIAICTDCPVRADCLELSMRHPFDIGAYGVWGGLVEGERRVLRRQWLAGTRVTEFL